MSILTFIRRLFLSIVQDELVLVVATTKLYFIFDIKAKLICQPLKYLKTYTYSSTYNNTKKTTDAMRKI